MNTLSIVADESVDFEIVRVLRENDFAVYAVAESSPALSDTAVLEMATANNALLITEDKDFGELVFRFNKPHCGILLLRLIETSSLEKAEITLRVLQQYADELKNTFSVLEPHQLRLRK